MRATINGLRIAVIALGCYWVLIFISTHIPANAITARLHQSDKLVHAVAFAGLAFLMAWAFPTSISRPFRNVFFASLVGILYAGMDELLQIPVGRIADWKDFLADCIGICIGLTIYTTIRNYLIKMRINLLQDPIK